MVKKKLEPKKKDEKRLLALATENAELKKILAGYELADLCMDQVKFNRTILQEIKSLRKEIGELELSEEEEEIDEPEDEEDDEEELDDAGLE